MNRRCLIGQEDFLSLNSPEFAKCQMISFVMSQPLPTLHTLGNKTSLLGMLNLFLPRRGWYVGVSLPQRKSCPLHGTSDLLLYLCPDFHPHDSPKRSLAALCLNMVSNRELLSLPKTCLVPSLFSPHKGPSPHWFLFTCPKSHTRSPPLPSTLF